MNLLDENIIVEQRQLLRSWRLQVRQIGREIGRPGMTDQEIIPLLHRLGRVTFFTRDQGFYRRELCHSTYSLVHLAVGESDVAGFVRRFLRHPLFNTRAKRMGRVIRVSRAGIRAWRLYVEMEQVVGWGG